MDFGIAKFAREESMTATDQAIGTVHYISPEQADILVAAAAASMQPAVATACHIAFYRSPLLAADQSKLAAEVRGSAESDWYDL